MGKLMSNNFSGPGEGSRGSGRIGLSLNYYLGWKEGGVTSSNVAHIFNNNGDLLDRKISQIRSNGRINLFSNPG